MSKLHEVLAAEKTPQAAWNTMQTETLKKFGNVQGFFTGMSKSLSMLEESPANVALQNSERVEKALPTNVYDTLDYALAIFAQNEDLQFQKNATNRVAVGTVLWLGEPFMTDLPVDELLGLEARLAKIRELIMHMPTLDATKHWEADPQQGKHVWRSAIPDITTKTEKMMTPVEMSPATDKHPAQVQAITKDVIVGSYKTTMYSGAVTATQKADAILNIDELSKQVKQARMRANETVVTVGDVRIGQAIARLILKPLL